MSSRATKKRIWRAVREIHGWGWSSSADVCVCRCGLYMTGMQVVQMGEGQARLHRYAHLVGAYRAEQRARRGQSIGGRWEAAREGRGWHGNWTPPAGLPHGHQRWRSAP